MLDALRPRTVYLHQCIECGAVGVAVNRCGRVLPHSDREGYPCEGAGSLPGRRKVARTEWPHQRLARRLRDRLGPDVSRVLEHPHTVLEGWAFVGLSDPFKAPEQLGLFCVGHVRNDVTGRHPDGARIETSPVVEVRHGQRQVVTQTGSVYQLGEVNAHFRAWAEEHCPQYRGLWEGRP